MNPIETEDTQTPEMVEGVINDPSIEPDNISTTSDTAPDLGPDGMVSEDIDDSNEIVDSEAAKSEQESLIKLRLQVQQLLQQVGVEGEYYYLIPRTFLDDFLNYETDDFPHLKTILGPIDAESIVDDNGILLQDDISVGVPPDVFNLLANWFGISGRAPTRAIISNNGEISIEKFPPYFVIHNLTKTKPTNTRHKGFYLSQTQNFEGLIQMVRMSKNSKDKEYRVWLISDENIDDLPATVNVGQFINLSLKYLINRSFYKHTLKSKGVTLSQYHLLIEPFDESTSKFPITEYLQSFNLSNSNFGPGGHLGLINLGNTCYMNSALQCLVHIPELNQYFHFDAYEQELNVSNPLGFGGNMAKAFASLIHKLFNDPFQTHALSPREFKYTIGHYSSMFSGYQQQDSQEFLSWLLDSLHEDLNRIVNKPYVEKPELQDDEIDDNLAIKRLADTCWEQFKQRNDSVIVDLFSGLYQSILVCPDCSKTSITYDPYNDLTLPLPINKKWYHTFTVVNLDFTTEIHQRIMKLQVELNKTSNFEDLLAYLTQFLHVPREYLFIYEIYNNFIFQDFQSNTHKYKFIPISEVMGKNDDIIIYIIPHTDDQIILPVFNTVPEADKSYRVVNNFGIPLFITLDQDMVTSFGKIRGKLEQVVSILTSVDLNQHYKQLKKLKSKQFYSKDDFSIEQSEELEDSEEPQEEKEEQEKEEEEEVYDSDVSLADPEISGDYGFIIKYYEDTYNKLSKKINTPARKPYMNNLPKLADLLPKLKYNYYHYRTYQQEKQAEAEKSDSEESSEKVESEIGSEIGSKIESLEGSEEELEHVPNRQITATPNNELIPSIGNSDPGEVESPSSDQTEGSEEQLGSLFDSVHTLKETPKARVEVSEPIRTNNHPILVKPNTMLVCEWDSDTYKELFEVHHTWENLQEIPNPELEANKRKLQAKEKSVISLYDCLDNFNQPEVLGDQDLWYCPRCKDHKQATKTIKIWSTGDILTIHLKRFQVARSFSDKIAITIDFPIQGLDMTKYVNSDVGELVYDLIGVDNHYGGLGGGHYTSSVLNFKDNQWYYFNDSHVSKIKDPSEMINGAAYLLFYRKRANNEIGSPKLNQLINERKHMLKEKLEQIYEQVNIFEEQDMETVNKKSRMESKEKKKVEEDQGVDHEAEQNEVDEEVDDEVAGDVYVEELD